MLTHLPIDLNMPVQHFARLAKDLRQMCESHPETDCYTAATLEISFNGSHGDTKILWSVYSSGQANEESITVKGSNLVDIVQELLRRRQANTRMAPLCLPRV